MMKRKGTAVVIRNEKDEVLLLKRALKARYQPEKWEQCGGAVEDGESFEEAIVREAKEELGVEIEIVATLLHDEFSDMGDGVIWEVKVFEGKLLSEPSIQEPDKCVELKWIPIKDLAQMDLARHTREDFEKLGWI